jgi:hypothetical protein
MVVADVEKQGTGEIAVWLITAWFIWAVLFISTFISAFVIFRMNHDPWEGTDGVVLSVAIVGIVASVFAWMSYEAPAFFRRRSPRLVKSPNARYFLNFLLSMFLADSVCVFGQVCAFMGLPLEIVTPVFFGVTWLLFAFHFPTKSKITRWTDGSAEPRTVDPVELQDLSSVTVTASGALRQFLDVLKVRWAALLAASGVCMLPSAVIGFPLMQRRANLETLGYFDTDIGSIVSIPFFAIAGGSVVVLVMGLLGGREIGIASSIGGSLRRLVPLVIATFLTWTAIRIGSLLLVVPGIILSVRLAVTIPVLLVEEIGPLEALRRAWTLSRAHQLAIFGGFLAVWLVAGSLAIGAVFPFLDLAAGSNGNPFRSLSTGSIVLTSALSWCAATIGAVLQASLATVFYVQITEQGHAEALGQVAAAESQPGHRLR